MTAEERMRERAAQWCRDFASSRTIHNTTFPDTAARSALQLEQAIRALPLEGEQGEPDFRTPEERKFCDQLAADAAQDQRGATSHEVTGPRDRAAESAPHHSRAEQEPTEAVRVTTSGGGPAPAREPVPYDGVANKAQYEAECAHAEQAAREPAVEEVNALPVFDVNLHAIALRHAEELDRLRAEREEILLAAAHWGDQLDEEVGSTQEKDVLSVGKSLRNKLRAENAALREQLKGGVVVPMKAWEGFLSMVSVQLGKPTNRDKSPAEILEMARAVLAAAKEPK